MDKRVSMMLLVCETTYSSNAGAAGASIDPQCGLNLLLPVLLAQALLAMTCVSAEHMSMESSEGLLGESMGRVELADWGT
jgi:hypothetical protein